MSNVEIYLDKSLAPLDYKSFVFNGGEVSIKLPLICDLANRNVKILARIQNSNDFFFLANVKDALERMGARNLKVFLPCLPFARQDRLCDLGESFSLKVFCDLLNGLNFAEVTVLDCHSDVGAALINNINHVDQLGIINKDPAFINRCLQGVVFVSPDAGANKKTAKIAGYFEHKSFIRADKLRDLTNGKIKEIVVYADDLSNQDVVILDDIIDLGGTFMGLAKELKKKNARKVILYATHAICPKGFDDLFNSGIDEIWVTNSFREIDDPRVNVFNVKAFL
jgi:ribose-phosphate pyrophosphokinase